MNKIILAIVAVMMLSLYNAQQVVAHVNKILAYDEGVLDLEKKVDFWMTIEVSKIEIPHIEFLIIKNAMVKEDFPLDGGGTISTYDCTLIDQGNNNAKIPIQLGIMHLETKSYLILDWLDGYIIYYNIDEMY